MPRFTPTEQKILAVLSDGKRHLKDELRVLLSDGELSDDTVMQTHVSNLRKKLNPIGQDIICEYNSRRIFYRHVRLISFD